MAEHPQGDLEGVAAVEPAAGDDELSEICEHNYEILVARVGAGETADGGEDGEPAA